MKLKRFISALIVFTLVLTSAVCSVSADATYQVSTSYDVASQDITVNAKIADATDGSMVSYIVYVPVEGVADVNEDGSNIKHIDQATISGSTTMDTVTVPFSEFEGAKVKFTSSVDTLAPYEYGLDEEGALEKVTSYTKSVGMFSKLQTGLIITNQSDSGQQTKVYTVDKDGTIHGGVRGTNLSVSRWQSQGHMNDLYNGILEKTTVTENEDGTTTTTTVDYTNSCLKSYHPLDNAVALIVDLENQYTGSVAGRDTYVKLQLKTHSTSFTGALDDYSVATIFDNGNGEDSVGLMINGLYKESIEDLKIGPNDEVSIGGGTLLWVDKTNVPHFQADGETLHNANSKGQYAEEVMTIDAQPIYGTYTNGNGTYPSVTYLVTASDVAVADIAGLKFTAYPKGSTTLDNVIADDTIEPVELGICANAYSGYNTFAIQLFDSANEGYLNPDEWDVVATPVVMGDNDEWIELTTVGTLSEGRYFSYTNRLKTAELADAE